MKAHYKSPLPCPIPKSHFTYQHVNELINLSIHKDQEYVMRIYQQDFFYKSLNPLYRLKIRIERQNLIVKNEEDDRFNSELIYYKRKDGVTAKLSEYYRVAITSPEDVHSMKKVLNDNLGDPIGVVRKQRLLYMIGNQTRCHIDIVEGLGNFIELEVVLNEEQTTEDGENIIDEIIKDLGIKEEDMIDKSYFDLLYSNKQKKLK